ncbi:hypothetical protein EPUS_08058 [Endocarpon pusillum Z07020]|uniref:Alpha box domain-containing protein n=1 Tax=Endocarpon pusillum (strain Z07020 / HMAS-L-300199) TaxID=1263415 RepID=U1GRK6_ENDPU|nr:uncharacterized protein EPUS_08058 [Endocarpon pusillum Z07020]ERF75013.1 hypothetical protein EPUS_08058 [Endocarpon pusillum Z07020]
MSFPQFLKNHATFNQPSRIQEEDLARQSAHRGVVAKDGVVQQSCTDDFLIVLCVEFCKAQSHQLISRLRQLDRAEQDERIGFIAHEIRRLLHHPRLFSSESSRVRFLTFLAADSRFQLCEAISGLLMQSEVQDIQEAWQKNVSRKGYLDGTRGWENFLLSDAPGLPFTSDRTTPESTVQVLPPVASRIVAGFEKEEREILHFVRQNNPPLGRPAQMTTMIDFDNPTENSERVPDAQFPQIVKQAIFRPKNQAIGSVLRALVTNLSNMAPDALNQLTEQICSTTVPDAIIPVMTDAQLDQYDGNPGGFNRPRSRAIMARNKADVKRKDRVNLRPLNGFICFRSYYSPIFAGLTQKIKSGLVRQLWQHDHWKHFWAIEAKAYSEIRDAELRVRHKNNITLDQFLTETVGLLGVIPADKYLSVMGWELLNNGPSEYFLVKVNAATTMLDTPLSTNLSAADMVKHCYETGLVEGSFSGGGGVAMAFAAQPSVPKIPNFVGEDRSVGAFTDEHGYFDEMIAEAKINEDASQGDQTTPAPYAENLSIETATADVQRALEDYPDEYPYAHHFHPEVGVPILAFDPTVIQDDFDPFDLGDYVEFDV